MGDGQFVVPITTDDGQIIGWGRGPEPVENANYHKCIGTPLRHLRLVGVSVVEISQAEKDALFAADALAEQRAADAEAARVEQQRLDGLAAAAAAESANGARVAQLQELRAAYVAGTHALCDVFGIARVDALPMLEIQQRGAQLTDMTMILQAMQTAMALSNIEGKLRWLDGDGALDRVSEVAQ